MTIKTRLKQEKDPKNRIWEIDFLRGLPIIVVILYHMCWSFLTVLFSFSNYSLIIRDHPNLVDFCSFLVYDIMNNSFLHTYIVPLVGGIFIFVCGISTSLSKNNLKRAGLLWLVALLISGVTLAGSYIFSTNMFIDWGIIHLMAFSITIYALLELFYKKVLKQEEVPFTACLTIAIIISFIAIFFWSGYCPINFSFVDIWPVRSLSSMPFENYAKHPLALLFEAVGYYKGTTDWWPILPYTGVIFYGIALGKVLYGKEKKSKIPSLNNKFTQPISFIGRHTLIIYLIHQIVFVVIFLLVFLIMGFRY